MDTATILEPQGHQDLRVHGRRACEPGGFNAKALEKLVDRGLITRTVDNSRQEATR